MKKKRVAFLSPHAGIWAHALPEGFLAKSIDDQRFEVSRISCDGTFQHHCTVMEASRVTLESSSAEKEAICRRCIKNADALRPFYRGRDYKISRYLSAAEAAQAKQMVERLDAAGLEKLTHLGVEVGTISSYETLLKYKKTAWAFSEEEFAHLKTYATHALMSLMAFRHLYEELRPDILICYSPQYAVNGVCARYCELQGTKVYFVEGSANLDERYKAVRVWDWTAFGMTNPGMKYWPEVDRHHLSEADLDRARAHNAQLVSGHSFSVYSEPEKGGFNLREHFGVPEGSKVILAAMSSYDEAYSAYVIGRFPRKKYFSDVFPSQLEWIRDSIPFFAKHPELFFIIRIHPRTFPNKREAVMAPGQRELQALFENLPPNVRVNYPTDKISIYDLYKQIDVLVTGWSATGVEAMTWGVPVVTYDSDLPSYPASIHYTGKSADEYFQNLLAAAKAGRSQSVADNALKWMAFYMCVGVIRHPMGFDHLPIVMKHRALQLGLAALEKFVPKVLKRIEAIRPVQDRERFNELLERGAPSLFEVPRK